MDTLAPDRDPALTDFPQDEPMTETLAFWIGALNERLGVVEDQLARVSGAVFPEPDFDSGWATIEGGSGLQWDVEQDRDIARADVLIRTGPDSFEVVPSSPREGEVWARPYPPDAEKVRSYMIYSRSEEAHEVRIQGWYAQRS